MVSEFIDHIVQRVAFPRRVRNDHVARRRREAEEQDIRLLDIFTFRKYVKSADAFMASLNQMIDHVTGAGARLDKLYGWRQQRKKALNRAWIARVIFIRFLALEV